jgi:hypothetical protein
MEKITGSHKGDQEFIPEKKIKYVKVIIPDSIRGVSIVTMCLIGTHDEGFKKMEKNHILGLVINACASSFFFGTFAFSFQDIYDSIMLYRSK